MPVEALTESACIVPALPSPVLKKAFGWWLRRMFRSDFHSVRILSGTDRFLTQLGESSDPAIVVANHSAWWDPLLGLYLHDRFMAGRAALAPMDAAQLRRFSFFRRLGIFGIEPDSPHSLKAMTGYVRGEFERNPRSTVWITPQGEFADVRLPIRVRPGAAALAAQLSESRVDMVALAIEYVYWTDRRPELMLAVRPVERPKADEADGGRSSTPDWTRAIRDTMQANATALAEAVISRDDGRFDLLVGRSSEAGTARVNPLYDVWLRATGRAGVVRAREPQPTMGREVLRGER